MDFCILYQRDGLAAKTETVFFTEGETMVVLVTLVALAWVLVVALSLFGRHDR